MKFIFQILFCLINIIAYSQCNTNLFGDSCDFDQDGIINLIDIDDDNDGVLDSIEIYVEEAFFNNYELDLGDSIPSVSFQPNNWIQSTGETPDKDNFDTIYRNSNGYEWTTPPASMNWSSQSTALLISALSGINDSYETLENHLTGLTPGAMYEWSVEASVNTFAGNWVSGSNASSATFEVTVNGQSAGAYVIAVGNQAQRYSFVWTQPMGKKDAYIKIMEGSGAVGGEEDHNPWLMLLGGSGKFKMLYKNDFDQDSIPNQFDRDSDGDGCFDAFESGVPRATNYGTSTDSITEGPYGSNGLADSLEQTNNPSKINYNCQYKPALNSFTYNCARLLPVELLNFEIGENFEKEVESNWSTATEINNEYFTLEKSKNGIQWETIGKVAGAGNSNKIQNYSLIDHNPFKNISYYRLKQTDFDGEYSYSSIKTITIDESKRKASYKVYPNPSQEKLFIEGINELRKLKLYNNQGQEISTKLQLINTNENNIELNVSDLSPGVYIAKFNNNHSIKINKQ